MTESGTWFQDLAASNRLCMEIARKLETTLSLSLQANKVLVIMGARRVGKTRLMAAVQKSVAEKSLFLNGDDWETHRLLEDQSVANYSRMLGDRRLLILDEAQEIPNIGKKLKLMVDSIDDLKVMISGSSAFDLHNQTGEPLVGRMYSFHLYPLAQIELSAYENRIETLGNLEERLVYGGYPELWQLDSLEQKAQYLKELVNGYLLKDILAFEGIKKRDKILALLQKLAFRSGSEISMEAMGRELQISKNTVEKYFDLFRKVYILYDLPGFSRNRDNEITKMKKWYFVDNGIRNALIGNFNKLNMREDAGRLWESYLQSERMKKLAYKQEMASPHFWRTHTQQEIDRIEMRSDQSLQAYEYKWGEGEAKQPTEFRKSYPEATFTTINRQNYLEFIH